MGQELEQDVSPEYIQGFNEGYLLRQHNPELANSIARSLESIPAERAAGFLAGGKEYDKEREQVLSISWMQNLPEDHEDHLPDKNIDKDDIEPGKE